MNEPRTVSELLRGVLGAGRLAMDIGAHVGDKTEAYLALGAHVVCVEPLPACVAVLRQRFHGNPRVVIAPCAVGHEEGRAVMSVCSRAPYLSTLSAAWKSGRFHAEVWDHDIEVPMTTLNALIAGHGFPHFCKIDVEGYERHVLSALDHRLPALSFEFACEASAETVQCLDRLAALGYTCFNLALGQSDAFACHRWAGVREVTATIAGNADPLAWGDVYAISDGA